MGGGIGYTPSIVRLDVCEPNLGIKSEKEKKVVCNLCKKQHGQSKELETSSGSENNKQS